MGTFHSRHRRRRNIELSKQKSSLSHSQTTGQVQQNRQAEMYSPFRGLRRSTSNSAGSLLTLPSHSGSSSNHFSYPYPRTHTTLVVPSSAVQQRDRPPLFDDSPTSATAALAFGQTPSGQQFRRPPLNRAIPTIPESRSNESIISQASQLTHRHSISGTSVSLSQKDPPIRAITSKEAPKAAVVADNSVVIENRMATNLATRHATNIPITTTIISSPPQQTFNSQPSTSEQITTTKKTVAIITTRRIEEPITSTVKKPTRLPLATNKKTRTNRDTEPKSPLLSMAHSLRSRINKMGTRIVRAASRSPIRSSRSMVSMRRDTSNLDRTGVDKKLSKSTSEQPVVPPTPPATSPPNDEDLEEQPPSTVVINSQRTVSQVPRRFPSTTLIPSPVGVYFRRLPEEDRLELNENEGPILTIDSKEALATPDEKPAPILLLRKVSGELAEIPLENAPPSSTKDGKRANFRRHKHSHSFGGDSSAQIKTPKMTARLIVRQPSEPLYYQTHRRSKSRDAIIEMQTPRVALKHRGKTSPTAGQGDESVKTTRSFKIVTYSTTSPELANESLTVVKSPKTTKKTHKKSSSVDISTVCAASKKYSLTTTPSTTGNNQGSSTKRGATALCMSASASKADEMKLYKGSLIPRRFEPRTVKWVNKNKRAPLAIAEQTRVANSPAVELPPNSFEDADLQRIRQSRLSSPAKARRMIFWRSKSKSASEKTDQRNDDQNNNASKSVDQASPEIVERTITTARITTKAQPPSPPQETDSNGNNVQKTPKTERETRLGRLTLNDLLSSPLTSHKRVGNTRALQAKQRSGLIDDEIIDQPMLISTELALIDESTPHSYLSRDLNENFEATMQTTTVRDADGNVLQQRTVRVRENDQSSGPVQYVPSTTIQQQPQHISSPTPKLAPHEHAAIEKIIEDLSSQLTRIKEYAVDEENELEKIRTENTSLKEELQIKDQVIQLLMNRLNIKDPGALSTPTTNADSTTH